MQKLILLLVAAVLVAGFTGCNEETTRAFREGVEKGMDAKPTPAPPPQEKKTPAKK